MLVEAKSIERVDADTYRIVGGTFSSCTQPSPRWNFAAGSARLHVDDKVVAKNVVFHLESIPAFYLPYFVYPIQEDQRSTGVLFPHFGYSGFRGFNIGSGFFWAMNRSFDQTFYADNYSKFGWGLGHEFRYALDAPSRADFRTYVFRRDGADSLDYDIDWSGIQQLPGTVRSTVNVRRYSDTLFQERFQDSLNLASSRTERSQFSLQRSFGFFQSQLVAEDNRTFYSDQERINKRLPSLRLSRPAKKIGRSNLVFGFDSRGEHLERGNQKLVSDWSRFHVAPQLSLPVVLSYLQVHLQVAQHHWQRELGRHVEAAPVVPRFSRSPRSRCSPRLSKPKTRLLRPIFLEAREAEARQAPVDAGLVRVEGPAVVGEGRHVNSRKLRCTLSCARWVRDEARFRVSWKRSWNSVSLYRRTLTVARTLPGNAWSRASRGRSPSSSAASGERRRS